MHSLSSCSVLFCINEQKMKAVTLVLIFLGPISFAVYLIYYPHKNPVAGEFY